MDAAHLTPRTTRSHSPLLPNNSDLQFILEVDPNLNILPNFFYNHPSPLMFMPPYYGQFPHHHIMNNLMVIPSCYYVTPPYLKSLGIQRPLPPKDPELYPKIVKQIEYYFSQENLVTDTYLKNKMDRCGWVDVSVIAKFRRIKALTDDIYHILEALVFSSVVQVRGHKMRVRYGWKNWINPSKSQPSTRCNIVIL